MERRIERLKDLLCEFARLPGVSGNEQEIVRVLQDALKPLSDEIMVDPFGNVIATRHGPASSPRLMIAAHSDEVGAVVTAILPNGLLRFQTIGVVNWDILPSTRVRVANKIIGTVTSVPGHLTNNANDNAAKPPLSIDTGAQSQQQANEWGIRVGSPVVFESPLVVLNNPRLVMGKAIDNRIGCATLVALFEELSGVELPLTLYGVVNVLEEIGMRGAKMTATRLNPDFAIALDTVPTSESSDFPSPELAFKVGHGPVIQLREGKAEQFLGTVAHPKVRDLILNTAEAENIQVQLSAAYGHWTTDGAALHTSGVGIPTGFVSIPRRYSHTPNEIMDLKDAFDALRLLQAIVVKTGSFFKADFLE